MEFLEEPVEEEVNVPMVPGYEKDDPATGDPPSMELQKSLYGLRQSPLSWCNTIDDVLGRIGFTPLRFRSMHLHLHQQRQHQNHSHGKTVITALGSRKVVALLNIHVDDIFLGGADMATLEMPKD